MDGPNKGPMQRDHLVVTFLISLTVMMAMATMTLMVFVMMRVGSYRLKGLPMRSYRLALIGFWSIAALQVTRW